MPANPVVSTLPLPDGGTARLYWNGMVDAIDGSFYSLSPGFNSLAELWEWLTTEYARICSPYPVPEWHPLHGKYPRTLSLSL